MEISDIIKQITNLNRTGIELSDKGEFGKASSYHLYAMMLAASNIKSINPDHYLFSASRSAYAQRFSTNNREATMSTLEKALEFAKDRRASIAADERTFFGEAAVKEEMALLLRYFPMKGHELKEYRKSICITGEVMILFSNAAKNTNNLEILEPEYRKTRYLRSTGLIAPIILKAAEKSIAVNYHGSRCGSTAWRLATS